LALVLLGTEIATLGRAISKAIANPVETAGGYVAAISHSYMNLTVGGNTATDLQYFQ